jgi:hypothetical protein
VLVVPLAIAAVLVAVAIYVRGGTSAARGRGPRRATPRPRRHVSPWMLTLLRPLFTYNVHRDAYVLRAIGTRRGPVLRLRRPEPELEPARSGRFDREQPSPVAVATPQAAPPRGRSERPRKK